MMQDREVKPAGRIELIDALRGFSIVLMVFYHLGYNLVMMEYLPREVLYNPVLGFLQPFFAGVFILISGISCRFSRSNLKRGLLILGLALAVTVGTWLYARISENPKVLVTFGILHFLGFSITLYALLGRFIDRIPRVPAAVMYIVLFIVGKAYLPVFVPFSGLDIFGFISPGFISSDYFSVFPWIFCFLFGTWLGAPIREGRFPGWFYTVKVPFFSWAGRHTLVIYVAHQPVLMLIMLVLNLILRR